jgi:hypothetical protein
MDRGGGCLQSTLGKKEQGQTWFRLPPPSTGIAIRFLGIGELATQPVQLASLIACWTNPGSATALNGLIAYTLRFGEGARPIAM